jgi:hypothetical protein
MFADDETWGFVTSAASASGISLSAWLRLAILSFLGENEDRPVPPPTAEERKAEALKTTGVTVADDLPPKPVPWQKLQRREGESQTVFEARRNAARKAEGGE